MQLVVSKYKNETIEQIKFATQDEYKRFEEYKRRKVQ